MFLDHSRGQTRPSYQNNSQFARLGEYESRKFTLTRLRVFLTEGRKIHWFLTELSLIRSRSLRLSVGEVGSDVISHYFDESRCQANIALQEVAKINGNITHFAIGYTLYFGKLRKLFLMAYSEEKNNVNYR